MKNYIISTFIFIFTISICSAFGGPAPPANLAASDHPWDGGDQIDLTWNLSPDDATNILVYKIYRSLKPGEVAKEDADAKTKAIKSAKALATTQIYLEAEEKGLEKNSPEVLAMIRDARKVAAENASVEYDRIAGERAGEIRFKFLTPVKHGIGKYTVEKLELGESYLFKIVARGFDGSESDPIITTEAVSPIRQGFDGARFSLSIITFILCSAVVLYIRIARTGRDLKVRKIAGLEAVDEAVGRATEMGRSVLFIPGIQDMNEIQTIAGLTVLSRVAKTAAEYDAKVEVPTSRSLVMTAARETVQAAFYSAGRPDAYNQDMIYYVTDEQFGYVAYLSGMMVREKPAACFYMGSFFAESLILAETGNSIGAIQIAGTAQPAQLPFFVAACDYTLIGEEFFAASAYLSGEPEQLGSLKGQDVGKAIVAFIMIIGIIIFTAATVAGIDSPLGSLLADMVRYLKEVILT